jgi:GNAT superfamily N-acetyltransferase
MGAPESLPVTLRDGRVVTLAIPTEADNPNVARLLDALEDPRAAFFERAAAAPGSGEAHGAIVARTPAGEIAGFAAWIAKDPASGEFAGGVDPTFAELGLGTLLVRRSAADARDAGLRTLRVELHPGSHAIAAMLRDCGLRTHWDLDHPVAHVDLVLGSERPGWVTPQRGSVPA